MHTRPFILLFFLAIVLMFSSVSGSQPLDLPRASELFQFQQKLSGLDYSGQDADTIDGDNFGSTVAIENNTIMISAPEVSSQAGHRGAIYHYERIGNTWQLQSRIVPQSSTRSYNDSQYPLFIENDRLFAGGYSEPTGEILYYKRNGDVWEYMTTLTTPPDESYLRGWDWGNFMNVDGNTIVAASSREGNGMARPVDIFLQNGNAWELQQTLLYPTEDENYASNAYGHPVVISGDTIMVGASEDGIPVGIGQGPGAVFTYFRTNNVWNLQQKILTPEIEEGSTFGKTLSLDGDTALIGKSVWVAEYPENKVYVYTRSSTTWSQQAVLNPSHPEDVPSFGETVLIKGDLAFISAPGEGEYNIPVVSPGAVYIFKRNGNVWTEQQRIAAPDRTAGDRFGESLAFSGNTLVIGDSLNDIDGRVNAGAAYVYTMPIEQPSATPTPTSAVTETAQPTHTATPITATAMAETTGTSPASSTTPIVSTMTAAITVTSPSNTLTSTPELTGTAGVSTPQATATQSTAMDVLLNGDFEAAISGGDWVETTGKRKCNKPDKQFAYQGNCAYQFKGMGKLTQNIDLNAAQPNAGDILAISGYYSAKANPQASVKIRISYANSALQKGKITVRIDEPGDGYQPLEGVLSTTLTDQPGKVKVQLQSTSGKILFDAIGLTLTQNQPTLPLPN